MKLVSKRSVSIPKGHRLPSMENYVVEATIRYYFTITTMFNLLNRWNGGPIEGRVISPDFGRPIGQLGPPRTLEAGLRIGF